MATKKTSTFDSSKKASVHPSRNAEVPQSIFLIWLDNNIDKNSTDYRNTIRQFEDIIKPVNTFTDGDQCIQFIETINNKKAHMVVSGSVGQNIVPRVHDMSQLECIFIFCGNKKRHEQWARDWAKIKGVYTEIAPICEALKRVVEQDEQSTVSISAVKTSGSGISFGSMNQLDPSFMYTQILKEILLSIKFEGEHFKEFLDYCRKAFVDNEHELNNVKKIEREYYNKTPIWWYTYDSFLYAMLNRSLRQLDVDIIVKMGFFIRDLHFHIEQLHSEQFKGHHTNQSFCVYRGQGLPTDDFKRMSEVKGGLMSFSSFLSTQKERAVSLEFARRAVHNSDLVGILFVMIINPSESSTSFASVNDVSYFPSEDEVLFSTHTVFRIGEIKTLDKSGRLFQVDLTLTSDTDEDLRTLTDHLRKETCQHSNGWYRLGLLLIKMGQFDVAQHLYERLLGETPDEREKGNLYHQIGSIKIDRGEYAEAVTYFEKALTICKKTLPPKHPHLASSYNNMGLVYDKIGEYSKALESHEKALLIYEKIRPPNHPDLLSTYDNFGLVYNNMKEYVKALSYHEKVLDIRRETLPPNHPDLATSYYNIGSVYNSMQKYSEALSFHEKSIEIRQRTLPPNHPDLALSYNNIGLVYNNMGEYQKARLFYERAVNIGQKSLPPYHPDLQMYIKNLHSIKKSS